MLPNVLMTLNFAASEPDAAPDVPGNVTNIASGRKRYQYGYGYRYIEKGAAWITSIFSFS